MKELKNHRNEPHPELAINDEFDTAVQMFHRLKLDRNNKINKEQAPYLKQRVYNSIEQRVEYYPDFLDSIRLNCSNNHVFTPSWLAKRPPLMPFFIDSGKLLQPRTGRTPCPHCGEEVDIQLDRATLVGDSFLYGDEAFRDLDNLKIASYSLVSKPLDLVKERSFLNEFFRLKSSLVPKIHPSNWILHYKELFNDNSRRRQKHLAHLSKSDVIGFSEELGDLLQKYQDDIVKWNCTGVYLAPKAHIKKSELAIKERTYYPLLMRVINEHTKSGFHPHFYFERTGNDGWAKNLFKGGRLTLMWPFISNCLPVSSPEFVPPKHSPFLEIADFISYVIARYLYIVGKNAAGINLPLDCNPSWIGTVRYLGFKDDGTCIYKTAENYPLDAFFKGTKWSSWV